MVGDDDALRAGLDGLLRAAHGHYALDDEGHLGVGDYLAQLGDGLAARVGVHGLEEGEARAVDVHGGGEDIVLVEDVELLHDGLDVPGLNRGHAHAADLVHRGDRTLHNLGVDAVAGEAHGAVFDRRGDEDVVVGEVVVGVGVVHGQGAYRGGEDGQAELAAEEAEFGGGHVVVAYRVHVDEDALPGVIVARRAVARVLGAGAGHGVGAGLAVADRTRLAVGPDVGACFLEDFVVGHGLLPPIRNGFSYVYGSSGRGRLF